MKGIFFRVSCGLRDDSWGIAGAISQQIFFRASFCPLPLFGGRGMGHFPQGSVDERYFF